MTRSRIALVVALLALFLGATTTAYSAGLARNSVGTAQLKKNAVTAPKIKKDAVTTAKVRNGAVTRAKLKAGVVPAAAKTYSQNFEISNADLTFMTVGGLTFTGACKTSVRDFVSVTAAPVAPVSQVSWSGTRTIDNSSGDSTAPVIGEFQGEYEQLDLPPMNNGFSTTSFTGTMIPNGRPASLVQIVTRVDDGGGIPCKVRIAVTPLG